MKLSDNLIAAVQRMICDHALPPDFVVNVENFYLPLAHGLAKRVARDGQSFIGLQGSQGSGKSTAAQFLKLILQTEFGVNTLVLSLDDFYLSKAERVQLAQDVHPLFCTRGVPGTHDINLINLAFNALRDKAHLQVPAFDKSTDDRVPSSAWRSIESPVDLLIFEGWCVGVEAQADAELLQPVNDLERIEDANLIWRRAVNHSLQNQYAELFSRLDALISLQAPNFDCVYGWRLLQEQKMLAALRRSAKKAPDAQTPEQIKRFISHYQRLTQHALITMPQRSDWSIVLNEDHSFKQLIKT